MTDILLRNILGAAFDGMPEAVRRMHSIERTQDVRGISRIMGGKNLLSWLIRVVAALPTPAHRAPISIRFIKGLNDEEWDRRFGKRRFHTIMKQEGQYLAEHLVAFPVTFVYDVRANQKGFSLARGARTFFGHSSSPVASADIGGTRQRMAWPLSVQYAGRLLVLRTCHQLFRLSGRAAMTDEDADCLPTVIIYDGMCHLCSGSMAWLAHRVPEDRLKFMPVQSAEGAKALQSVGLNEFDPRSFLLISRGEVLQKSRAVIATLYLVGGLSKALAWVLKLLPMSFADRLYDWVATNRYKWFGRRDTCFIPR